MKTIYLFLLLLLLLGCNNEKKFNDNKKCTTNVANEISIKVDTINFSGVVFDSTYISNKPKHDYNENKLTDSMIINTVKGLSYVKNVWLSSIVYCFDKNEDIIQLKKINDSSLLAITRIIANDNNIEFFFNDINLSKKVLFRSKLPKNWWAINSTDNFIINGNGIIYYITNFKSPKFYKYNTITKKHSLANVEVKVVEKDLGIDYYFEKRKEIIKTYKEIDDNVVLYFDKPYYNPFISPNKRYKIKLKFFNIDLKDNLLDTSYSLISTDFVINDGAWCFGSGNWNDKSDKFYFDNSGEIACIWEINLKENTIDKIVAEHEAKMPLVINNTVYYSEMNCIMQTNLIEKGKVIVEQPGFRGRIESGIYNNGLKLAYNPSSGLVTGIYENYSGYDESTGESKFSCIFYIYGFVKGNEATIATYYPTDKKDNLIKGIVNIVGENEISIKLKEQHGGCWNVSDFTNDSTNFKLEETKDWIEIRYINTDKAYFYTNMSDKTKQKNYVLKGDIIFIDQIENNWIHCRYYGKKVTEGWIKYSSVNQD